MNPQLTTNAVKDEALESIKSAIDEQISEVADKLVEEAVAKFTSDAREKIRARVAQMIPEISMWLFNSFEMERMGTKLTIRCEMKDMEKKP